MTIDKEELPSIKITSADEVQKFGGHWYRGENCNFIPSKKKFDNENFVKDYILQGFLPKKKIISKKDKVVAFGSCFAWHVSQYLADNGYSIFNKKMANNTHIIRYGEGMANTFTVVEQLEWAFENKKIEKNTWYYSVEKEIENNEKIRESTFKLLSQINVFIITFGLSEVWYNKENDQVFWKAIPSDKFNKKKHGFRNSTVEENTKNIEKIYTLIKKHMPNSKIIFTLSPIPLMATFRPQSCITANTVSKSILRVAIDNVISKYKDNHHLSYYPAYEITKEYFIDPFTDDNRHLKQKYIDIIMSNFFKYYCD